MLTIQFFLGGGGSGFGILYIALNATDKDFCNVFYPKCLNVFSTIFSSFCIQYNFWFKEQHQFGARHIHI